ncbi:STAS domain-containing protein [Streptomyces fragilis]|uniref:STAS domain-containing protein n=1 Tax=Streptomyces fragilis TaxID=67301 RepID=A0ABV2YAQ2_9ACTN|nr:STAS domain-containing protein [Streptomyces fragilis]
MTPLTVTPGTAPGGRPLLTVAGEIDLGNAGLLARELEALEADAGPERVVVDLTAVDYLDSAGLSVLFVHAERLEIVASSLLEPVLTYSGLTELAVVRAP